MASSTVENYLKAILGLSAPVGGEAGGVSVGAIAEELEVTPGTVTSMMRHLSGEGLVDYVPRRNVGLTRKGRRQALSVVRRHRLVETFLVEVMGFDWSEVHEEAEVLEHVVSDRLLERMDEMLGRPSHDPHGDPIPDASGKVAEPGGRSLADADPGRWRVARVGDGDNALLDWLREHGLVPGAALELAGRDKVAGVVEVRVEGGPRGALKIGERAAGQVFVEAR